jgi:hypothetical protein
VRHLGVTLIVGLLTFSASGLSSFIAPEPCDILEAAGQSEDEGSCAPTCVTCGCCAQAAEWTALSLAIAADSLIAEVPPLLSRFPRTDPLDVLHVPKRVRF